MASLNVKTMEKIRDDYLKTYRTEMIRRGVANPNISFGMEIYVKASSFARQIAIAMNNTVIKGDALTPDTAQNDDLERYAGFYGLNLKPASGSIGQVILRTTIANNIAILIAANVQLQDLSGLTYQTVTTGSYKDGDLIDVQAIDTGISTNLAVGTVLRWVTLPAYAEPTVEAGIPFTGGSDNETIESLRVRVLQKLANPPGGGNWSQVAEIAESSTPSVQKAFIYPACNGPATAGVAVASAPTENYKGRDFGGDVTILNNNVIPNVLGNFPEFADFIITNCVNMIIDVTIGLSLPSAKTASIPGNGIGWLDGVIFPRPIISGETYLTGYCDVASVVSSTVFLVNADETSLPATTSTIVNICWLSKQDFILRTAKATVSGGSSPYTVTLTSDSDPFTSTDGTDIAVGDYVFPGALNMLSYVDAVLAEFAGLGPGQKVDPTVVSGLFPRAFRRPLVQDSWASDMGPSVLKFIRQVGNEVADVQYLFKEDVGAGAGKCPIPSSVLDGPYILVPNNLAFYPII